MVSETVLAISTLNAAHIVSILKPQLENAAGRKLESIPQIIRPMAARTGVLLAWVDRAISNKTKLEVASYQEEYRKTINSYAATQDIVDEVFGLLPFSLGKIVSKVVAEFIPDIVLDGSLNIFQSGEKLKEFYRNLQRAMFNEILNTTIFGDEGLLLGIEFNELKGRYSDFVIGAWDREKQRLPRLV